MASLKNKLELLSHDKLKANINGFIVALHNLSFLTHDQIVSKSHERFKKQVPQLLTEGDWKLHQEYLRAEQERFSDLRDDGRLGFTLTFRKIRTVRQVQIELMKYLKMYVDSDNELNMLKENDKLLQKEMTRRRKNKKISSSSSLMSIEKGKAEAAEECWEIYLKNPKRSPKEICSTYLKNHTIKGDDNYSAEKLLNYFSKIKQSRNIHSKKT